jgi:hypothetical protein
LACGATKGIDTTFFIVTSSVARSWFKKTRDSICDRECYAHICMFKKVINCPHTQTVLYKYLPNFWTRNNVIIWCGIVEFLQWFVNVTEGLLVPVGQCRHTRHREEKCGVAGTEINEKLRG